MNLLIPKGKDTLCTITILDSDGVGGADLSPTESIDMSIVEKKPNRESGNTLLTVSGVVTDAANGVIQLLIKGEDTENAYVKVGENEDGFPFMSEYYGILYRTDNGNVVGMPKPLDVVFIP